MIAARWWYSVAVKSSTRSVPVLETLVHRQNDEAASAGQAPVVEQPGQVGAGARVVAGVPGEDFTNARFHLGSPSFLEVYRR